MDKRFLGILAVLIAIFIGIFAFTQKSSAPSSGSSVSGTTSHVINPNASVKLVEYGDYECSVCYGYYQPLKDAFDKLGTKAAFQFSNLPLSQIHPNAVSSARAAEAAGLQGKYWEMHDLLYSNQDPSGQTGWVASKNALEDYYVKYADQLKLNLAQFRQDFASAKVNDAINADVAAFTKTGQQKATPTFFLDGQYIPNSKFTDETTGQVSSQKIIDLVNAALSKKSQ